MGQLQIDLVLDEPVVPPDVAAALRRMDAAIRLTRLDREMRSTRATRPDARLVITSPNRDRNDSTLEAVYQHCDRSPCATLVLTPSPLAVTPPPNRGDGLPIGFASGLSADELAGRLTAMCAFQRPLNQLRTELEQLRNRERLHSRTLQEHDEQMRQAAQIQRDLLPDPLPEIRGASLHTLYLPADRVSGDVYDVVRVDGSHVALSLTDATGHGLPAALLTMFIRRALLGQTPGVEARTIRPPEEVLADLNRDVLQADLSQCQFLTGCYGVYEESTRRLRWARGGCPYPILIRPGEPPRQLASEGRLIGVFQQGEFESMELTLQTGDVVVFHTDGLDGLLLHDRGRRVCDDISETTWYQRLAEGPIAERLQDIAHRADNTLRSHWPVDDLTVLALEVL
ncbi:MAG: SpoIIE family protein phosphatase [bacterium]|nr:SpoIIE family protein phosphatase [bacterium]